METLFGFELHKRKAYDVFRISNIDGSIGIYTIYAIILYDSIKQNFKWWQWRKKRKYKPRNIMKMLTEREIVEWCISVLKLEGKKEDDLVYHRYLLGEVTEEGLAKWFEKNKKKVELVQTSITS